MKNTKFITICITVCATFTVCSIVMAAQEASSTSGQPIVITGEQGVTVTPAPSSVIAPQGLTPKERSQLEKQYRFSTRNKAMLLNPYVGSDEIVESASIPSPSSMSTGSPALPQTEEEKMYRYFGVALALYKNGRSGEAIEILRYISDRNPNDKYVKNTLDRIVAEQAEGRRRWMDRSKDDAQRMRRETLKSLTNDGIDYYKQKRFDMALLKFADVLAMDPDNAEAKRYFDKLKEHYLKETRVEDIIASYESGEAALPEIDSKDGIADAANAILDDREKDIDTAGRRLLDAKEGGVSAKAGRLLEDKERELKKSADKILDEEEMMNLVEEKRLSAMLDEADAGITVDNIMERMRKESMRKGLFTLGAGDVINATVRDHPELSGRMMVRLDGNIILPLVNDPIKVKGLTVDEVTAAITDVMKRYVREPYVAVVIEEYKSKTFYVIDEVGCTPYPITRANLTLRDALFIADWGNNRALGRVIVMRPNKIHPIIRKVDAFDIIYRGNLANNIIIEDGDVIYVPMTYAAKVTKAIIDSLSPIAAVKLARDEWLDMRWNSQEGWGNIARIPRTKNIQDLYSDPSNSTTSNTSLDISTLTLGSSTI